ncbi:suppressor of fused domain protein [Streptomyces sp. NBC_01750]|uniref:suppressor of fused domain protein n=1 Tax=Streptomyces sp. NBC_01750 TaxID=2975928 RepID=UPI002DDB50E7|nr:suppressor of fused domain protein [Streptomyces sp. NBC_01750]WSD33348.1 suppressor of fused domain protein [Streptomyces sp. NBC_01750]
MKSLELIAQLGLYSARTGKALSAQNIYRSDSLLWSGTELAGFVITRPFDDELTSMVLADGRHVEFLMLVPAFSFELDFASSHGIEALVTAQEQAGVEFWDPYRKPVSLTPPE